MFNILGMLGHSSDVMKERGAGAITNWMPSPSPFFKIDFQDGLRWSPIKHKEDRGASPQ